MLFPRLVCGCALAAAPLLAHAQAAPAAAPAPRYYVGLAAYASNYLPLGQTWRGGFPVPLQATAGYQLSSRWALQASVAYSGRGNAYEGVGYYHSSTGPYPLYTYSGQYRQRLFTAAVLGRYTLTRQAAHRLQVDALGGLALVHTRYQSQYTQLDSAAVSSTETYDYRTNDLLLTAGLGVRYRLAPQLEATYNVLVGLPVAGYATRSLHSSMALGLQYRFGRR